MPILTDPFAMPEVLLLTNMYHPNVFPMSQHGSTTVIYGFKSLDFVACPSDWAPQKRVTDGVTLASVPPLSNSSLRSASRIGVVVPELR